MCYSWIWGLNLWTRNSGVFWTLALMSVISWFLLLNLQEGRWEDFLRLRTHYPPPQSSDCHSGHRLPYHRCHCLWGAPAPLWARQSLSAWTVLAPRLTPFTFLALGCTPLPGGRNSYFGLEWLMCEKAFSLYFSYRGWYLCVLFKHVYFFAWLHQVLAVARGHRCATWGLFLAQQTLSWCTGSGLAALGMWDPSSPAGDWTHVPCAEGWFLTPGPLVAKPFIFNATKPLAKKIQFY